MNGPRWSTFLAWAAIGAALAAAALTLQVALILALVAIVTVAAVRPRSSGLGALAGAGVVFVAIALVNRAGPGTTCWQTASAAGCDEHLDPIPWLVVGLVSLAIACAVQARRARRTGSTRIGASVR
jgi:hypothetical protein